MQTAARVAAEFRLDPVAVLAEPDRFARLVRIAATRIRHADKAAANNSDGGG